MNQNTSTVAQITTELKGESNEEGGIKITAEDAMAALRQHLAATGQIKKVETKKASVAATAGKVVGYTAVAVAVGAAGYYGYRAYQAYRNGDEIPAPTEV